MCFQDKGLNLVARSAGSWYKAVCGSSCSAGLSDTCSYFPAAQQIGNSPMRVDISSNRQLQGMFVVALHKSVFNPSKQLQLL